ncbi:hypothetical protein TRVA0_065S00276 [Trichomonascus vanleenenianus]|uniref:uncharacterized protein n=1 Tax=Trichomonascus vanleenenianus TaxID=2268995 RepID=UPI003ECA7072
MSALFPDSQRYEGSPYKRFTSPKRKEAINLGSPSVNRSSPTKSSSSSSYTQSFCTRPDFAKAKSTQRLNSVETRFELPSSSRKRPLPPQRSPIRLRSTTERLTRQLKTTTLASSRPTSNISSTSRGLGSPPNLRPITHMFRSNSSISITDDDENFPTNRVYPKRRKIVTFDSDYHPTDKRASRELSEDTTSVSELKKIVISLQEHVSRIQSEHRREMAELRALMRDQTDLIKQLMR